MPAGIEIYNADGTLQIDIGTRLFRVLNPNVTVGASAGSVTVPNQGTVIVAGQTKTDNGDSNTFTVSGSTVSWGSGSGFDDTMILVY